MKLQVLERNEDVFLKLFYYVLGERDLNWLRIKDMELLNLNH